jgi:hypothetical protein
MVTLKGSCFVLLGSSIILGLILMLVMFSSYALSASARPGTLQLQWQQFLPGISGNSVIQAQDGGYLVLGTNASVQNTDLGPTYLNQTSILIRTDASGGVLWLRTYLINGSYPELNSIIQTSDGGYALAGSSGSEDFKAGCLIKTDSQGNVQWSKLCPFYPSSGSPFSNSEQSGVGFRSLVQTVDGGYTLVGNYYVGGGPWVSLIYLVETDSVGNLRLNTTISLTYPYPNSIVQTGDLGYVILGEFPGMGGGSEFGIIKIDSSGNVQWTKAYRQEDSVSSYADCGIATGDGGYILGGRTIMNNYDHGWLVKTDSQGNMMWNRTYDDAYIIYSIAQTHDGGYVFGGTTNGSLNYYGEGPAWIAKLDSLGNTEAEVKTGETSGRSDTIPAGILEAGDDGYVCAGTWNQSYDASSYQKFWLAKISSTIVPPVYQFISISTEPSSATLASPVNISGRLFDSNGNGLQNKTVILSYTFEGYGSWMPISSSVTDALGDYSVQWMNTATGTFTIKVEWVGNATIPGVSNTATLSSLPYNNQYVFYIESNSTISALAFNSTSNELNFNASGPSDTAGYAKVTIAKSIITNSADIKVYLDGNQLSHSITSTENSWILTFNYYHSAHQIMVSFAPSPSPPSSPSPSPAPSPTPNASPTIPEMTSLATIIAVAVVTCTIALLVKTKKFRFGPQGI